MVLVNTLPGESYNLPGQSYIEHHHHHRLQENPICNGSSNSQVYNTGNILKPLAIKPSTGTPATTTTTTVNDNDNQFDYYNDITKDALGGNGGFNFHQNDVGLAMAMVVYDYEPNGVGGKGKEWMEKDDDEENVNELVKDDEGDKDGFRKCLVGSEENHRCENLSFGGSNLNGQECNLGKESEKENEGFEPEICEGDICKTENEDEVVEKDVDENEMKDDDDQNEPRRAITDDGQVKREIDDEKDDSDDENEHDSCSDCDDENESGVGEHGSDYDTDVSIGDGGSSLGDNDDDSDDDDASDIDVQSFLAQLDDEIAESESDNPAIDKGYAWIVVFAVFLIQAIILGYMKSGGIFFVEFQRQFEATASMTSLIIGLVDGIFSLSAPIVLGFLVKVFSVRQLCLVGSLIFVVGVVGNALCDRVEYLLLTHSFCFGIANGLVYGPSIYIINEYFKKKRALALSIATTGASFGGIAFPFLARFLFDSYGFAGGIVMTGGVIMQIFIGSVLLIPVKHHERNNNTNDNNGGDDKRVNFKDVESNGFGAKIEKLKSKTGSSIIESFKRRWISRRKNTNDSSAKSKIKLSNVNKSNSSIFQKHQSHTIHNAQHKFLGTGIKSLQLEQFSSKLEICEEGVPLEIQSEYHTTDNKDKNEPAKDSVSVSEKKLLSVTGRFSHFLSDNTSLSSQHSHLSGSICSSAHHGSSRHRLDVPGGNPNELGVFPNILLMSSKQTLSRSIMFQSTSTLNNTIADIISIDQDFKRLSRVQSPDHDIDDRNISTFRRMCPRFCDSPLLRSASFWVLVPYYFSGAIGVGLSQIFLLPFAKERGLTDDQAAFCLSLLNMLDVVAHLVPGILLNFGIMTSVTVGILPMLIVGIVGHLTPFFHSYESIMAMAVTFGLCMGFFYALQSMIVIDTLGIENYTSSIGIYYLVCGMGGAVSYPIAGALKDTTGTYTSTYQYLATMQLVSVAILVALPLVKKFDVRRGVLRS